MVLIGCIACKNRAISGCGERLSEQRACLYRSRVRRTPIHETGTFSTRIFGTGSARLGLGILCEVMRRAKRVSHVTKFFPPKLGAAWSAGGIHSWRGAPGHYLPAWSAGGGYAGGATRANAEGRTASSACIQLNCEARFPTMVFLAEEGRRTRASQW